MTVAVQPAPFAAAETLDGQEIVGVSISTTVTENEQVVVFPAPSVAPNTCVVTPTGNVAPLANPAVCRVVAAPQLSVPAGVLNETAAPQVLESAFIVTLDGQLMLGASVSLTVTVNEQVAVKPARSVAK